VDIPHSCLKGIGKIKSLKKLIFDWKNKKISDATVLLLSNTFSKMLDRNIWIFSLPRT